MKEYFKTLARYNRWPNVLLYKALLLARQKEDDNIIEFADQLDAE